MSWLSLTYSPDVEWRRGGQSARSNVSWGRAVRMLHTLMIITIFAALLGTQHWYGGVNLLTWPVVSGALVLLLGVPHGSLDVEILMHRRAGSAGRPLLTILLLYIAMAASVLVAWYCFPSTVLALFLLISAYHFGGDWRQPCGALGHFCLGAAMLSATALHHAGDVTTLFSWLAPVPTALVLADVMQAVGLPLLSLAGLIGLAISRHDPLAAVELAVVLAAAVLLPPLTFFVVYFCCLHSVRHVCDARVELSDRPSQELVRAGAPYALLAIVGSGAGALLLTDMSVGSAVLSSVFVTLAALTVPHMVLVDAGGRS